MWCWFGAFPHRPCSCSSSRRRETPGPPGGGAVREGGPRRASSKGGGLELLEEVHEPPTDEWIVCLHKPTVDWKPVRGLDLVSLQPESSGSRVASIHEPHCVCRLPRESAVVHAEKAVEGEARSALFLHLL